MLNYYRQQNRRYKLSHMPQFEYKPGWHPNKFFERIIYIMITLVEISLIFSRIPNKTWKETNAVGCALITSWGLVYPHEKHSKSTLIPMYFKRNIVCTNLHYSQLHPEKFAIRYVLSVTNGHVPAILPYVSDTGAWSLERSIFSFMLGFGALLMLLTFYIRYRQVKDILDGNVEEHSQTRLSSIHRVSFYCTFLSVVGVFTLGCFQVQPFFVAHVIGAFTAFGFGWVMLVIQTYISFKIYPLLGYKGLNTLRAILLGIITTALILTLVFGVMAFANFRGNDITKWTEDSGGYNYHLISTGSEWFLIFGVVFYLSLYAIEFKPIVIFKPKIKLTNEV